MKKPTVIITLTGHMDREEFRKVFTALSLELKKQGVKVYLLQTKEEQHKFVHMTAQESEASILNLKLIDLLLSIKELGHLVKNWLKWREYWPERPIKYSKIFKAYIILAKIKKHSPKAIIALKFNHAPEVFLAAETIKAETFSIQHGNRYFTGARKNIAESYTRALFVWDEEALEYIKPINHQRLNLYKTGPIWKIKYDKPPLQLKNTIIIYESSHGEIIEKLVNQLNSAISDYRILLKPHSLLVKRGVSAKEEANNQDLTDMKPWINVPEIAISMRSSITQELIYLGIPVIHFYCPDKDYKKQPPEKTGFFKIDDTSKALETVYELVRNINFKKEYLSKQQQESAYNEWIKTSPLKSIAKTILGEAPRFNE